VTRSEFKLLSAIPILILHRRHVVGRRCQPSDVRRNPHMITRLFGTLWLLSGVFFCGAQLGWMGDGFWVKTIAAGGMMVGIFGTALNDKRFSQSGKSSPDDMPLPLPRSFVVGTFIVLAIILASAFSAVAP
jgi:hypothetical protein